MNSIINKIEDKILQFVIYLFKPICTIYVKDKDRYYNFIYNTYTFKFYLLKISVNIYKVLSY